MDKTTLSLTQEQAIFLRDILEDFALKSEKNTIFLKHELSIPKKLRQLDEVEDAALEYDSNLAEYELGVAKSILAIEELKSVEDKPMQEFNG